jgi:SAM-dependent methyltransferase
MSVSDAEASREAKREARAFYEHFTEYLLRDRLRDNPRHRWIRALLRELFRRRSFASALDVGCGIGLLTQEVRRHVPNVMGFDLSESNVRFARETVQGVEFRRADLTVDPLPFRVDLITAFDVLEHIPWGEKRTFLHHLIDHTAEGGWILLTIPTPAYLEYQRRHAPHLLQIIDESVTASELAGLLEGRMEIRECRTYAIDYVDQYKYYLLGFPGEAYVLRRPNPTWASRLERVRGKLQWGVRSLLYKKRYLRIARALSAEGSPPTRPGTESD